MFLLIDSSPYSQAEPCELCKALMEVGPPPMADAAGFEVQRPRGSAPCRHSKRPSGWSQFGVDRDKSCA